MLVGVSGLFRGGGYGFMLLLHFLAYTLGGNTLNLLDPP